MKFRSGLEALQPYSIEEANWPIKLDANERTDGLPPTVAKVISERLAALPFNRYPEITAYSLRKKLAAAVGCTVEQIQVGNGSSELLAAICHVFGGSGHKIVYPEPSFSMYPVYIRLADSQPVPVKLESDYSLSIDAFRNQAQYADLAIVCNPNNPTGNVLPPDSIAELARELTCPLVVDEAYLEFYKTSAVDLLKTNKNLIIVRTFSKAYGLAAARIGYLLTSTDISAAVGKVLLPYHVNALSLLAAETVLDYQAEFVPGIEQIICERSRLANRLAGLPGITVFPSETNFLLIKTERSADLAALLATADIGIRDFSRSPGLVNCLRISIGSPSENNLVFSVIERFSRLQGNRQE
ncbi:histidinol phosphate aminotransferase [Anaerosporomusa subterranea]|uniref:Histidinol-phosphate aminotransferase n=1 Tax=Anaerosporomusa subterranea TaxID=1794912 RepID=A0A154BMI4_ANASB|nr:histidinol-phosphate transaminase [Anaerosporomusa subterranea]KYZ75197.1 histidinol phosphate aminotransferase [Anaerosporomusa subterranea]